MMMPERRRQHGLALSHMEAVISMELECATSTCPCLVQDYAITKTHKAEFGGLSTYEVRWPLRLARGHPLPLSCRICQMTVQSKSDGNRMILDI